MLLIKNGRFHISNASFVLPDNTYLVTMDSEGVWENGIEITNREEQFHIIIRGFQDKRRGADFFMFLDEAEPPFRRLSLVTPIRHNGLKGHQTYYESGRHTYCEWLFDLEERDGVNGLHIVVFMKKSQGDIFQITQSHIVQELIASVWSESGKSSHFQT